MRVSIKHWPADDRPRERARALGPRALSTRELLAILLGTGRAPREGVPGRSALELAGDILDAFAADDGEESLRRLGAQSVCSLSARVPGIGPAKAARVLAALDLGRRASEEILPHRTRVKGAQEVYRHMRARLRDLEQEEFHVLLLNTQRELLREVCIARGTLDESVVHPRDVYRPALAASAAAVILVHNHPSGEPAPSEADLRITADLVEAGDTLGIFLDDHVIVGDERYWSFREHGRLRAHQLARRPARPPSQRRLLKAA
jgi:DNA repair protein RadC